ncbi:hypothetical protein EDD18DRAFT_1113840 [Armillaria luteobubalina]|uniref:Uncharacterized protein n=1 Tax=Armillaria luteobubalina TaxID=153913 RepID=A0AA39UEN1_9AGAR|nr:hypothetical protein EDD18DRAFT_1113840 [Armillaria luteobubalina]
MAYGQRVGKQILPLHSPLSKMGVVRFWGNEELYSTGSMSYRAGGGVMGGRQVTVGSVGKTSLTTIFPHSKSGRCLDMGAVGVLDEAGGMMMGRAGVSSDGHGSWSAWASLGGAVHRLEQALGQWSGRCTATGLVAVLERAGEGNVGVGGGCQQQAKYWGCTRIIGHTRAHPSPPSLAVGVWMLGVTTGSYHPSLLVSPSCPLFLDVQSQYPSTDVCCLSSPLPIPVVIVIVQ